MPAAYRVQHLAPKPPGWRVRSKRTGSHVLRIAFPPGRRKKGAGKLLEILHPKQNSACSEGSCKESLTNPAELLIFGNPRPRHAGIGNYRSGCSCAFCKKARALAEGTAQPPPLPRRNSQTKPYVVAFDGGGYSQTFSKKRAAEMFLRRSQKPGKVIPATLDLFRRNAEGDRMDWSREMVKRMLRAYNEARRGGMSHAEAVGAVLSHTTAGPGAIAEFRRRAGNAPSVPEKHQISIAKQTLRMADAMVPVMGGMSKAEAREILRRHGIRFKENAGGVRITVKKVGGTYEAYAYARGAKRATGIGVGRTRSEAKKLALSDFRKFGHITSGSGLSYNPARRRNQGVAETQQAVHLFEKFHGRPAREMIEEQQSAAMRMDYAALGDLVAIGLGDPHMSEARLVTGWDKAPHISFERDGVKLASSPNGKQLYLIGGKQDLSRSLGDFEDVDAAKDFVELGECSFVVYEARKAHDNFQQVSYMHAFSDPLPRIVFNQLQKTVYLVGGSYFINTGAQLSPGIEG